MSEYQLTLPASAQQISTFIDKFLDVKAYHTQSFAGYYPTSYRNKLFLDACDRGIDELVNALASSVDLKYSFDGQQTIDILFHRLVSLNRYETKYTKYCSYISLLINNDCYHFVSSMNNMKNIRLFEDIITIIEEPVLERNTVSILGVIINTIEELEQQYVFGMFKCLINRPCFRTSECLDNYFRSLEFYTIFENFLLSFQDASTNYYFLMNVYFRWKQCIDHNTNELTLTPLSEQDYKTLFNSLSNYKDFTIRVFGCYMIDRHDVWIDTLKRLLSYFDTIDVIDEDGLPLIYHVIYDPKMLEAVLSHPTVNVYIVFNKSNNPIVCEGLSGSLIDYIAYRYENEFFPQEHINDVIKLLSPYQIGYRTTNETIVSAYQRFEEKINSKNLKKYFLRECWSGNLKNVKGLIHLAKINKLMKK